MSFLSGPLAFPLGGSLSSLIVARIIPDDQEVVATSIVKLDGRGSTGEGPPITTYTWAFTQVPIGSQVVSAGFTDLEGDNSVVSFSPDIVGTYKVSLTVGDGSLVSYPTEAIVDVRVILVPTNQGITPDASFIWNYLSDFWNQVPDKKKFETFWSAAIQITASEALKLYQYQYNKSIRDIQDVIQKRWINYSPAISLDSSDVTFILADDTAGIHGSTYVLDPSTGTPIADQPTYSNSITIPLTDGTFSTTSWGSPPSQGRLLKLGNRSFTFLRSKDTSPNSFFFADRPLVQTAQSNLPWRFSSTLISSSLDFEALGVSPGDIMEIEVTRTDIGTISNFFVQIVSVDRNRVGFVLNLTDLTDGISAGWLTTDIQATLANDLSVSGLVLNVDGSLSYTFDAENVRAAISTINFRRKYFEKELAADTEINVGPFSIKARPVQIIRNKKIAIDSDIVSIPVLQEYIKQPDIAIDGGVTYLITEGGKTAVSREPYLLSENLDYIVDDESTIAGNCDLTDGSDIITIPHGDLFDRSIQEGDRITVVAGTVTESFDIRQITASDTIKVFPNSGVTASLAQFTITRRVPGKYLRFVDGVFTKTSPAPIRLWSEVTFFDNLPNVENNFGVLVGIRRADLDRVGASIPYKSAVAGLMYALSTGPTVSNLKLAAQILLGLPFAQNAGVITEINPAYRFNPDDSPKYGRILVEARDADGNPTGITNIYLYPLGRQVEDPITHEWSSANPDISGLAINPVTGQEYKVGDSVAQFAPLSKGVDVLDYISTPDWLQTLVAQGNIASLLQKYHQFEIQVNADLVTSADIDITAEFMQRAKAHYVKLSSSILKVLDDSIDIEDELTFARLASFFENPGLSLPSAVKLDNLDDDFSVITVDGIFYSRYCNGIDLVTTKGSTTVTSAASHFITADSLANEFWDPPLIRPGDVLWIADGMNAGYYPIATAVDDATLTIDVGGGDVQTMTDQKFVVFRPVKNPIFQGMVTVTAGDDTVIVTELDGTSPGGIQASGVAVGDVLVFADYSGSDGIVSNKYTVIEVNQSVSSPTLRLSATVSEADGIYNAWVVREQLIPQGHIAPYLQDHASRTAGSLWGSCTAASNYFVFADAGGNFNDWLNLAMTRPGDLLTVAGIPYTIMRFEPAGHQVLVTPPILATQVGIAPTLTLRPDRSSTVITFDIIDRIPSDYLQLDLIASETTGDAANTTVASVDVTLTVNTFSGLSVVPGDYLILLEGADSTRDVGYGVGIFPIHSITGGTTAHLMDQLTDTGTFRYGIRRKIPNEG